MKFLRHSASDPADRCRCSSVSGIIIICFIETDRAPIGRLELLPPEDKEPQGQARPPGQGHEHSAAGPRLGNAEPASHDMKRKYKVPDEGSTSCPDTRPAHGLQSQRKSIIETSTNQQAVH
ncbi:hypothetical protein EYF80_037653 [Liparis tanakae]|uniref:Uncharacterized protein n=1 Tax=Liparis tanakae TaxID=230148 RepID=A0A4Z2GH80_9TELE|nr:hypothetical protein EYF80_037653 [Liparis tanakae]